METVTVGSRIKEAREAAHLTQGELAARVGVATNSICRYERGRVGLSVKRARVVAAALGVSVSWLLDEEAA